MSLFDENVKTGIGNDPAKRHLSSRVDANLLTVSSTDTLQQILRNAIAAELDAINLYEKMAEQVEDDSVKHVLLDIVREEKTHAGEFEALLLKVDREQVEGDKEAAREVAATIETRKDDDVPISCAGILFRAPGPKVLLVKNRRINEWVEPGGHLESGETPLEAANREAFEEIGEFPEGEQHLLGKSISNGIEFTCYVQDVSKEFIPEIDTEEIADWMWAGPDDLPETVHPELRKVIELLSGNELDIAKAIKSGELASPQQFQNLLLFDVRITGTGTAYRTKLKEFVYRPPERFLTDEFLERCNGLPLIFEHPDKQVLNTDDYRERAIGTVILPYIKEDEVWGIAKVYDKDAAKLMETSHTSTSPAVLVKGAGSESYKLSGGKTLLIEGEPSYLDHLAVCQTGVWDKGAEPGGIRSDGDWSEEDHSRGGDPDNPGQFSESPGTEKSEKKFIEGRQEREGSESSIKNSLAALEKKFKRVTPGEFIEQRDKSSKRAFLTPYTAEEMKGWEHYLTDDGVGFSLTPEKDIVGVFNNSGKKGAGKEAVVLAVANGGKTLDCVAGFLDTYYNDFGFVEENRIQRDDAKAPKGWDYENFGRNDIVYFRFPQDFSRAPDDSRRRIELARAARKTRMDGRTHLYTHDEWIGILAEPVR